MNSKYFALLLLVILGASLISSVEFEIKEEVRRGENLVVKVVGDFSTPLTKDNIYFYRRHLPTSIEPYGIEKIDGDYYIYAQVPFEKEVDDYSIWLKDVEYNTGISYSEEDLFSNFTIVEEYASFSLHPGIIETRENYFITIKSLSPNTIIVNYGEEEKTLIEAQNDPKEKEGFLESLFGKNEDNEPNESVEYFEEISFSSSIELKPGETKQVEFPIEEFVGLKKIRFNYEIENYEVLVFMNSSTDTLLIDGEEEEENDSTPENSSEDDEIKNSEEEEDLNESTFENSSEDDEIEDPSAFIEDCESIGALYCEDGYRCEGNTTYSTNSFCCVGECVEVEKNNAGKTIGWILIVTVVLFLTWFFKKKYRGAKSPEVDLEKESRRK
jgi:hypothetical protein